MYLVPATNVDGGGASATGVNPRVGRVYPITLKERQCSWGVQNGGRRPATKQLVESLHAKIKILEAELAVLKGRAEVATESGSDPSTPLDGKMTFTPGQVMIPVSEHKQPNAHIATTVMYQYIFNIDASIPVNDQPKDIYKSLVCQWNRHLPQLPHFTRLEHDTILSRCFKYGVAWLHCMVAETFLHDMLYALTPDSSTSMVEDQLRFQHYTPMLHCALIAYASAFSDNPEIRSPLFRGRFARYAKQWLDYEFERPIAASVRALALLAEYHCGIGEQSAGFMYMGMSIRAARSLVLKDNQPWTSESAVVIPGLLGGDWPFWSSFCQGLIHILLNGPLNDT
ncbi:unnamed protein product [Rhizoctonia solani]|uniref:Xylanolytic transcriptional activator regulatory domain-containing protein n=1 Tax=Rhizoctonia solani TaxID=456999 RepID=A0A8H3BMI7_9AGAM|nr:unnamed protein product [Rhizoctonia solani]